MVVHFYSSPTEAKKVVAMGTICTQGSVVNLNKWCEIVNTIGPPKANIKGWIRDYPSIYGMKKPLNAVEASVVA